ncbi:transglutaminase-like domain-containing protein [Candidatus Woesearchaeota archaeon]|nr:transglutaminase-like domain-containing protein [Candidatus Woesearchaeota archaeon]
MKKRLVIFTLIFLLASIAYAQEGWNYNSQNLILSVDLSSEAVIEPTSSDYSIKYITVNLSHFPYESFNQKVISFKSEPEADIEDNAVIFEWQNPANKITFGYNAKIKTSNDIVKVKEKIKFPIQDLPEELKQFTEPREVIDSDDEDIVGFASEIAQGEDDLYEVVHKIAEWTKSSIEYDLSTLTEEVSQKASWVLDNKRGVCDELTSLFVAMLRSVGIPAKVVSGIAYTNSSLFAENWGSHGWAEVYFPGYGWIPYDVTYGEFGYIDPTHIKLKESVDSNEPSVQYKWVARNVELETKKLAIKTELEETIGRIGKPVTLDVKVLRQSIGFGSYNLVEAVLENLEDYYVSSEVYISRPKEVEVIGETFRNVLLKPNEKKSVFWILKLTGNLQDNFIYTFPVTVSTLRGFEKSLSFRSVKGDMGYTLSEIQSILRQKEEEVQKVYSKEIDVKCGIDKKEFYAYEKALAECKIKNIGNVFLESLNVCFEDECTQLDVGIMQEKSFNYTLEKAPLGRQESVFRIENKDVSRAEFIEYNVLDTPEIKIKDIIFPSEIEYEDSYKIEFLLSKESASTPENVEITMSKNNLEQSWDAKELSEDRKFVVNMLGKDLSKGKNEFKIIVKYEDRNGKAYQSEENFSVSLVNVTFTQNIMLVLNSLARKIGSIF